MSEKIDALEREIREIDSEIESLAAKRFAKRTKLACLLCPFKVGDKITTASGEAFFVDKIEWDIVGYRIIGARAKRNGEPYCKQQRLYNTIDGPFKKLDEKGE